MGRGTKTGVFRSRRRREVFKGVDRHETALELDEGIVGTADKDLSAPGNFSPEAPSRLRLACSFCFAVSDGDPTLLRAALRPHVSLHRSEALAMDA